MPISLLGLDADRLRWLAGNFRGTCSPVMNPASNRLLNRLGLLSGSIAQDFTAGPGS